MGKEEEVGQVGQEEQDGILLYKYNKGRRSLDVKGFLASFCDTDYNDVIPGDGFFQSGYVKGKT